MTVPATQGQLLTCCHSTRWAGLVLEQLPFEDRGALHAAADTAFDQLRREDWLEAFAHHPRIGDVDSLRERFAASGVLSEREQAGAIAASDAVLHQLLRCNIRYEQRFGFVFIVRATGRSAEEMLELLRTRLDNDDDAELAVAAAEQREITHLRIDATFVDDTDAGRASADASS